MLYTKEKVKFLAKLQHSEKTLGSYADTLKQLLLAVVHPSVQGLMSIEHL